MKVRETALETDHENETRNERDSRKLLKVMHKI